MQALLNRVIVKPDEMPEKTESGIYMVPGRTQQNIERGFHKIWTGTVISAGPGYVNGKGVFVKNEIKEGQRVMFKLYAGAEVILDGVTCQIMCDHDIEAIVNDD